MYEKYYNYTKIKGIMKSTINLISLFFFEKIN